MKWYIIRRLLWAVVATFIILTITFILMDVVPDQNLMEAEVQALLEGKDPEEAVKAAEERRGLDRPVHVRYVDYLANMVQGNWGWSHEQQQPVREVIISKAPYSLMYAGPAIILSTLLGTIIGLYSAVNQHTKRDYVATFGAFFGISIPDWWFGIILLVIFGTGLGWIDVGWNHYLPQTANGNWVWLDMATSDHPAFAGQEFEGQRRIGILSPANLKQLILPTFVLMTGAIASVMRYARAEALEYIDADFVKTAKSKGVSGRTIVVKHIFRPASIPLMTIFVGRLLALVLAGSFLIEIVFGIPGIGLAGYRALIAQDHDLVMATILIPTFLAVFGNLLEDLMYVVLDPRIGYGDR